MGPGHHGCTPFASFSRVPSVQRDLSQCTHWLIVHWTAEPVLVTLYLQWVLLYFRFHLRELIVCWICSMCDLFPRKLAGTGATWKTPGMESGRTLDLSCFGIALHYRSVAAVACCIFSRERLRRVLCKKAAVVIHLHTLTSADLHLHTLTSADLHLHTLTLTSADLHLHTLTSADLHLHTLTSADLHLHTLTSADLHLHTLTSADLHLHTLTYIFTPSHLLIYIFTHSHLQIYILHTLTPADLHLHTLTPADLHSSHPHICRSTSSHLHICRSTSSHLHICGSSLALLSISLLRRGRCRRSATKRNPFARNGRQKRRKKCDFDVSIATLSHEMDVGRQKLR